MRRLIVMRHAKAAWPDDVADHERPLTGRGRRDSAAAGHWLRDQGLEPDLLLVSSAVRTRQTMDAVLAAQSGAPEVRIGDDLYGATAGDLLDAVRAVDEGHDTVLLVGHNPGIGMVVALLDDGSGESDPAGPDAFGYPTAATTVFEIATPWAWLDPGTARIVASTVPRG